MWTNRTTIHWDWTQRTRCSTISSHTLLLSRVKRWARKTLTKKTLSTGCKNRHYQLAQEKHKILPKRSMYCTQPLWLTRLIATQDLMRSWQKNSRLIILAKMRLIRWVSLITFRLIRRAWLRSQTPTKSLFKMHLLRKWSNQPKQSSQWIPLSTRTCSTSTNFKTRLLKRISSSWSTD